MQGMGGGGGAANPMGSPPDMRKIFKTEKENLDLISPEWALAGIEAKILQQQL